jgi:hypothetical protein
MALPEVLTDNTLLLFIVFVIGVFIIYKFFKTLFKVLIAGAAGFSFPWVINYVSEKFGFDLPFTVATNLNTGIKFGIIAMLIVGIYELFHFILFGAKVVSWPLRSALKRKK